MHVSKEKHVFSRMFLSNLHPSLYPAHSQLITFHFITVGLLDMTSCWSFGVCNTKFLIGCKFDCYYLLLYFFEIAIIVIVEPFCRKKIIKTCWWIIKLHDNDNDRLYFWKDTSLLKVMHWEKDNSLKPITF